MKPKFSFVPHDVEMLRRPFHARVGLISRRCAFGQFPGYMLHAHGQKRTQVAFVKDSRKQPDSWPYVTTHS